MPSSHNPLYYPYRNCLCAEWTERDLHIWINMFCFCGITLVHWLLVRFKLSHRGFPLWVLETFLLHFNIEAEFSALLEKKKVLILPSYVIRLSYLEKHVGFWIIQDSLLKKALKSTVVVKCVSQWLLFSMSLWK